MQLLLVQGVEGNRLIAGPNLRFALVSNGESLDAELVGEGPDTMLTGEDPLCSAVDHHTVSQRHAMDSASDPVPRLQQHDVQPFSEQLYGCCETGETRANHKDPGGCAGGIGARSCRFLSWQTWSICSQYERPRVSFCLICRAFLG